MKKTTIWILICIAFSLFSSFEMHKFYVSIYQINQNIAKKRIEITARIFIDDLNKVLTKQSGVRTAICEPNETTKDVEILKKYLTEKIILKINGKAKPLLFKSKELETNVVICYFVINDISKIKTIEIENTAMLTLNSDQQNIIQTNFGGQKNSLLFTNSHFSEMLKL